MFYFFCQIFDHSTHLFSKLSSMLTAHNWNLSSHIHLKCPKSCKTYSQTAVMPATYLFALRPAWDLLYLLKVEICFVLSIKSLNKESIFSQSWVPCLIAHHWNASLHIQFKHCNVYSPFVEYIMKNNGGKALLLSNFKDQLLLISSSKPF